MLKSELILIFVLMHLRGIILGGSQDYNNLAARNVLLEINFQFSERPSMGSVMELGYLTRHTCLPVRSAHLDQLPQGLYQT